MRLGKIPNMLVIFVNWAPVVLMYMLDLQIWFMLWQVKIAGRPPVRSELPLQALYYSPF